MISKIPLLPFHPTTLPNCLLSLCLSLSFFEVLWSLFRVTCAGLLASHLRRMASQCRSLLFLSLSLLIVCNFGNGLLFPCASVCVCVCVCARCGGSSAMAIELKACIVDGSVTGSCKVGNCCGPWIHTCISIQSGIKMAPPGLKKYQFGSGLGPTGEVNYQRF